MYDVPVLMNVFRRPGLTSRVISALEQVKPQRLYVAADGPRTGIGREGEREKCEEVRALFDRLPWDCEVYKFYREENTGSRINESAGISWFFSQEPYGIILEDDCLPHIDFFKYCRELLLRHEKDKRIMHIAGTQVLPAYKNNDSYFFTRIPLGWGWASWADRWVKYDESMADYSDFRDSNKLAEFIDDRNYQAHWTHIFDAVHQKKVDAWDFIWIYYVIKNKGICINPTKNLISNIGFGSDGTYCMDENCKHANLSVYDLELLVHPKEVKVDLRAEKLIYEAVWNVRSYNPLYDVLNLVFRKFFKR